MSSDPTILSFCPVCGGSVDVDNAYVTDGNGEFWHRECWGIEQWGAGCGWPVNACQQDKNRARAE